MDSSNSAAPSSATSSQSAMWKRFQGCIESGEFYDAEQACRSAYFRAMTSATKLKSNADKQTEYKLACDHAVDMLIHGANLMIQSNQVNSTTSLAGSATKHILEHREQQRQQGPDSLNEQVESLIEICRKILALGEIREQEDWGNSEGREKTKEEESQEIFRELTRLSLQLISLLNKNKEATEKTPARSNAMEMDDKEPNLLLQLSELHQITAIAFSHLRQFSDSENHFLQCSNVDDYVDMVLIWSNASGIRAGKVRKGLAPDSAAADHEQGSAIDRAIARCHAFHDMAIQCIPELGKEPLMHFIELVCEAGNRAEYVLFQLACKVYKPSLDRDPMFKSLLDKISAIVFNVQPAPSNGSGGLLGSLMGDMMRGLMSGGPGPARG